MLHEAFILKLLAESDDDANGLRVHELVQVGGVVGQVGQCRCSLLQHLLSLVGVAHMQQGINAMGHADGGAGVIVFCKITKGATSLTKGAIMGAVVAQPN